MAVVFEASKGELGKGAVRRLYKLMKTRPCPIHPPQKKTKKTLLLVPLLFQEGLRVIGRPKKPAPASDRVGGGRRTN